MYIFCLPTSSFWCQEDSMLLSYVSLQRQERILRYTFEADKKLSLYAALLARFGISLIMGLPTSELVFSIDTNKKPFLLSHTGCHFNLSHTRNFVLCGICLDEPIGIDVEKQIAAPFEIMKSVFHSEEIRYVEYSSELDRESRFYKVWTRKEAFTKQCGMGLACDLPTYNTLSLSKSFPSIHTWRENDYICSVCGKLAQIDIKYVSESDIKDYFTKCSKY